MGWQTYGRTADPGNNKGIYAGFSYKFYQAFKSLYIIIFNVLIPFNAFLWRPNRSCQVQLRSDIIWARHLSWRTKFSTFWCFLYFLKENHILAKNIARLQSDHLAEHNEAGHAPLDPPRRVSMMFFSLSRFCNSRNSFLKKVCGKPTTCKTCLEFPDESFLPSFHPNI